MDKKEAYQIVLDDLMQCDLFRGKYDAAHGASEHYMYGICTVMEAIAYRVSEETGDAFSDIFILNMIKSEEKYEAMSKHTETHDLRTKTHGVCSDELISREDVIELIEEVCPIYSNDYRFILKDRVKNLPSANKSGHWIDDGDCSICSKCHEAYGLTSLGQLYTPNFCPNCGSRNIEEGENNG